ncbi:MAG: ComF family protein [Fulvivirga sp.]|nr:ComF family protein [Fulvivirga sp.]
MLSDFISLFFPHYCTACKQALAKGEKLICLSCFYQIPKTDSHLSGDNYIATKFYGKIQLSHVFAFFKFERKGRVQKILHQLKYGGKPELGEMLGQQYGEVLVSQQYEQAFDVVTAVPLHKSKQRRRGYNQSEAFGRGLAQSMGLPYMSMIKRIKNSATQTRRSRLNRWENVSQVFEPTSPKIAGQRILLVDDVITTGATLESCGLVLQQAGAKSVGIAAIAAAV